MLQTQPCSLCFMLRALFVCVCVCALYPNCEVEIQPYNKQQPSRLPKHPAPTTQTCVKSLSSPTHAFCVPCTDIACFQYLPYGVLPLVKTREAADTAVLSGYKGVLRGTFGAARFLCGQGSPGVSSFRQ